MKPLLLLHRGLEKLGKAIALLIVLLLIAGAGRGPVIATIGFSIGAAGEIKPIVGGGPIATTILLMTFLCAFSYFASVYVAPHVPIANAVGALLEPHAPSSSIGYESRRRSLRLRTGDCSLSDATPGATAILARGRSRLQNDNGTNKSWRGSNETKLGCRNTLMATARRVCR